MDTPNANLPTGSFDRIQGSFDNPVYQAYNNFRIQNLGGNIIQGQLNKISVTEIMFPYNTPTIVAGENDTFCLAVGAITATGQFDSYLDVGNFRIPAGFYSGTELVTALNLLTSFEQLSPNPIVISDYIVFAWDNVANRIYIAGASTFNAAEPIPGLYAEFRLEGYFGQGNTPPAARLRNVFNYSNALWTMGFRNWFASSPEIIYVFADIGAAPLANNIASVGTPLATAPSNSVTNLADGAYYTGCYTNYIDIVSHSLCQAQYLRDSTTSQNTTRRDVIARIYVCNNISTIAGTHEGQRPFIIYRIFPVPKVMKWTADRSIDAIDLTLYDMYGQILPTTQTNNNIVQVEVPERNINAGEADYSITLHCHEPGEAAQNQNVGYRY